MVGRAVEHHRLCRERETLLARSRGQERRAGARARPPARRPRTSSIREASLRSQLQRYVSPRLVDLAVANPGILELPGDWREATVLFADIRGFTRLIESTTAPVVIRLLNEYFAEMIEVIFRHQGTVEQLVGDEIVALFGVPEPGADVALRAVRAAVDMVEAVGRLAARWAAEGRPTFDIGIFLSRSRRGTAPTPGTVRGSCASALTRSGQEPPRKFDALVSAQGSGGSGGGNHRGTIFRLLVGAAVIGRDQHDLPTWGDKKKSRKDVKISSTLWNARSAAPSGVCRFSGLTFETKPVPTVCAATIEKNSIASS